MEPDLVTKTDAVSWAPPQPFPIAAPQETWRCIPGCDGFYSVSNLGRVRSEPIQTSSVGRRRGRILKCSPDTKGYLLFGVCLPGRTRRTMKVHHAVALAFLGPRPDGYQVNHKSGDKLDNSVANLEYVTCRENIRHCWQRGLHGTAHCRGEANQRAKLTAEDVRVIRRLYPGVPLSRLAALYGVTKTNVWSIVRKKTWQHV